MAALRADLVLTVCPILAPRLLPAPRLLALFEDVVRRVLGGAFLGGGGLQSFDFERQRRDALGQFLDRQRRQFLSDFMADFLPRPAGLLDLLLDSYEDASP